MWRLVVVLLAACGTEFVPPESPDAELPIGDLRVELPDPDPAFVDYLTPDAVVAPGETRLLCYHVELAVPEIAVDYLAVLQGPQGHHVSVMTTSDPKPPGTLEDCSTPEANAKLRWMLLTTRPIPYGSAMSIPQASTWSCSSTT
jgi:hypothetical protein